MIRTVAEKMGIKPGARSLLVHAPPDAIAAISLPPIDLKKTRRGRFSYIHLFVGATRQMDNIFPKLAKSLQDGGALWVSWPKGKAAGTDLTLPEVIRIGYNHGLVESTALRIDETWSALKFTRPKPGKIYRNSYGKLPSAVDE